MPPSAAPSADFGSATISASAPRCSLHVRVQRCAGLRSPLGSARTIDAFIVARIHSTAAASTSASSSASSHAAASGHSSAPDLSSLSSSPPASAAHAVTRRCRQRDPCFQADCSLPLSAASDWLSLAVCDASTPAAGSSSGSSSSARMIVGAALIPLSEVWEGGCLDRWFDLTLPTAADARAANSKTAAAAASSTSTLAALCSDVAPGDVLLQVQPDAADAHVASAATDVNSLPATPSDAAAADTRHSSPLGRIRVQLFATGSGSAALCNPARRGLDRSRLSSLAFPEERCSLSLHVITFNAGHAPLPDDLRAMLPESLLGGAGPAPDLVAIGLQECAFTPAAKDFSGAPLLPSGASCEASVIASFTRLLGPSYARLHAHTLWEMRLLLFARVPLLSSISALTVDAIPTGIANVLGNKGALVASLRVRDTSIALISCHLAAHTDRVQQRNADLERVARALAFQFDDDALARAGGTADASTPSSSVALTDYLSNFHHTFVVGDLNYRLQHPAGNTDRVPLPQHHAHVVNLIRSRAWSSLWAMDQLRAEQRAGRALVGFSEGQPTFAPSFKVLRNVGLGYTRKRLPSYCDRILWRSVIDSRGAETQAHIGAISGVSTSGSAVAAQAGLSPTAGVRQTSLRLCASITSSDHKPIAGSFQLDCWWKAGQKDHSRAGAEISLAHWRTDPADQRAWADALKVSPDSSLVLELRAAFLSAPLLCAWDQRHTLQLPTPLAYNNSQRMRRELVLARIFKATGAGSGAISAAAVPLARGCCVLQLAQSAAQNSTALEEICTLDFTLLHPGGILACTLGCTAILRWKQPKQHVYAAVPAGVKRSNTMPAALRSPTASALDSDDEEEDDDDVHGAVSVAPMLALRAKVPSHRSAIVSHHAQPSSLPTSSSASSALASAHLPNPRARSLHGALEVLSSSGASVTQQLRREHDALHARDPSALTLPAAANRSLTLLVALFVSSEEVYAHALHRVAHRYHAPLMRLAQQKEAAGLRSSSTAPMPRRGHDFSSASSTFDRAEFVSTPSALVSASFSNVPLLASAHAALLGEMEARLRLCGFGAGTTGAKPSTVDSTAVIAMPDAVLLRSLRALAEALQESLPSFTLYRFTLFAAARSPLTADDLEPHRVEKATGGRSGASFLSTMRHFISQEDARGSVPLSTLLALPLQRVDACILFCREASRILQRCSVSSKHALSDEVTQLSDLFASLLRQLEAVRAQAVYFSSSWYESLAREEARRAEADLYAQLAGESVHGGSIDSPRQRPSTAAVLRPHSSYDESDGPLATAGFSRPATSYGDAAHAGPESSSGLPTSQLHMLASRVQQQLRSRATLAGFHAYVPAHTTQEDITLDHRHAATGSSSGGRGRDRLRLPPPARSLSLSALSLFDEDAERSESTRSGEPHLSRSSLTQSTPARPREWSVQRACAAAGVAPASAAAATSPPSAHWSTALPPSLRKLQAGRALIALVDLRPQLLPVPQQPAARVASSPLSLRTSPSTAAASSHVSVPPSPRSAARLAFTMGQADEDSLYEDDFLQDELHAEVPASTPAHTQKAGEDVDVLQSVASEQLQRALAAAGRAARSHAAVPHKTVPAVSSAPTPAPNAAPARPAAPVVVAGRAPATVARPPAVIRAPPTVHVTGAGRPVDAVSAAARPHSHRTTSTAHPVPAAQISTGSRPSSAVSRPPSASSTCAASNVLTERTAGNHVSSSTHAAAASSPSTHAFAAAPSRPVSGVRSGNFSSGSSSLVRQAHALTLSTAFRSAAPSNTPAAAAADDDAPGFQLSRPKLASRKPPF